MRMATDCPTANDTLQLEKEPQFGSSCFFFLACASVGLCRLPCSGSASLLSFTPSHLVMIPPRLQGKCEEARPIRHGSWVRTRKGVRGLMVAPKSLCKVHYSKITEQNREEVVPRGPSHLNRFYSYRR